MSALKSMVDSNGEISKNDLQVHVKNSKIWKGFLECKAITGSSPQVSKVQIMNNYNMNHFKTTDSSCSIFTCPVSRFSRQNLKLS